MLTEYTTVQGLTSAFMQAAGTPGERAGFLGAGVLVLTVIGLAFWAGSAVARPIVANHMNVLWACGALGMAVLVIAWVAGSWSVALVAFAMIGLPIGIYSLGSDAERF